MRISPLSESEVARYDACARVHGTLFNTSQWLGLFGSNMQALGIFDNGGTLVGGLSLYHERRYGLRIIRRAPFTPTCGPFLEVGARNPVAVLEARRSVLECLTEYLESVGPAVCMLSLDRGVTDILPFFWHGWKCIPGYTYVIDLRMSVDQLIKNMSSDRRKNLSKATRDELDVRLTTEMNIVQDLVVATFERQGKQLNRTYLGAVLFKYANQSNSFAFTAYRGNEPIATCFVVHDAQTAYYLLGGYRNDNRHHGAGASAMFAAIQHAKEIGLTKFDFEGSMIPAIERYLRGFGGQLTTYFTVNKAWFPIEILLKGIKRNIF